MTENELAKIVIDYGIKIHKKIGPGLLESAYEACLYYELRNHGLKVERQKSLPLIYEDVQLDCSYRIDLLIEGKLLIELKSVNDLHDVHMAQVLTYLKLSKCKLGLLVNFNAPLFLNGVRRVINSK